ncbi:MAG: Unknown protein [uncultured Thiotrichaceae bacterium]|uniref:Uncharacterized protein n=1 Tax=uncultured Thiotrichaceae bacterium TaxID=298394 RepID=A0A6S6TA99_9GAMM|nr:MAG: Unknown protein [uncultured Thiotrichaceae bacterium]
MQEAVYFNQLSRPFFRLKDLLKNNQYRLVLAILIVIPLLIFTQAYQYDFVWDDNVHLQHVLLQNFSLETLRQTYSTQYAGMFIPVSYTLWAGLKAFSEFSSIPLNTVLHTSNIILHIVNSILVYLLLKNLIQNRLATFLGSLLFIAHPIQVETVVFVTEFRGLLATMFGLLAIYFHMKHYQKHSTTPILLLSLFLFILALLSKPSGVFVALSILLIHRIYYRNSWQSSLLSFAPYLAIVFAYVTLSHFLISTDYSPLQIPDYHKPAVWLATISFYLLKIISPTELGASYAITPQFLVQQWWLYPVATIPLFIAAGVWAIRRSAPLIVLASLLFAVATLATSGLITYGGYYRSMVGDRYIYFGLFAVSLLLAAILDRFDKIQLYVVSFVALIGLALLSAFNQTPIWKDGVTLWTHSIEFEFNKEESYEENIATEYYNRGYRALQANDIDNALTNFDIASKRNPTFAAPYLATGSIYYDTGNYQQAAQYFQKGMALDANYVNAYKLANTYAKLHHYKEAREYYEQAILKNPKHVESYERIAVVYYNLKEYQKAWWSVEKVEKLGREIHPRIFKALQSACPKTSCTS